MSVIDGMVGRGEYNRHSSPQMAAIDHIVPWLDEAIAGMVLANEPQTSTMADFGCSEGRNSITVMRHMVQALRQRSARPIQTIHSDLPTNDYSELFKALRPDGRSVFQADDVYSAVVAGSMFDRLLPPRSLQLVTTFNAIAFFSNRPVDRLPSFILANGPSRPNDGFKVSDEDHDACARRSRADLESFFTARAAELVPGGKLLVQVFGADGALWTCGNAFDALNAALMEMLDAGLIDRGAYETYYHPVYMRTLDDLTAPLTDRQSSCCDLFELNRAETFETPVDFVETYQRDGDANQYARAATGFVRVFTESGLRLAFAGHGDLDAAIEDIYQRFERISRSDPERYRIHFVSVAALMTRRSDD